MKYGLKSTLALLGGILLFMGAVFGIILVMTRKCSGCKQVHYNGEDDLWDEEWDEEDWRVPEEEKDEDIPF